MSRLTHHKRITAIAAIALLMAAAGAYAYWTQGGSGSGSATTGTTTALTIVQTSLVEDLAPGGDPQALSGTILNENTGTVHPASVTATLDPLLLPAGCIAADFTINAPTTTIDIGDVAEGETGDWSGPSIQMNNTAANQDACKAEDLVITYTSL